MQARFGESSAVLCDFRNLDAFTGCEIQEIVPRWQVSIYWIDMGLNQLHL